MRLQEPADPEGIVGQGTDLADLHLPIKINGDLALFQALGSAAGGVGRARPRLHRRVTPTASRSGGSTSGALTGTSSPTSTGLTREQITEARRRCCATPTGHRLLLGDGPDPAPQRRGHHQGDRQPRLRPGQHRQARAPACSRCAATPTCRATGRWASGSARRQHFLDALQKEFGFDPPREHGFDTVDSIRAMRDGKVHVFIGLGGNFVQAAPDTDVTVDGAAPGPADRAGLDQAQPLAPGLRRDRADPADAGPHREGHAGQRRRSASRWRTRSARCTPPAAR